MLKLSVPQQRLYFYKNRVLQRSFAVSTAEAGIGEQQGSWKTPSGWHVLRAKIGGHMPANTIFEARRPVGLFDSGVDDCLGRDWILGRIIWLSGLEVGHNRLGSVDTMRRYIYLHGTPAPIDGSPRSHGCVRLSCTDMITLYQQVSVGDRIFIDPNE
jgi:L,D-transpeptidase YbiS